MTGLAQWAGTRIRSGSQIRSVPGSIPGTAGSDFLSYVGEICEEFGTCLGDISEDFQTFFGFCSDMFGNAVGTFCGHLRSSSSFLNLCIP